MARPGSRLSYARALAAAAALACVAPLAHADLYMLVEDDGTVRMSRTPDDPRYQLYLREPTDYKLKDPAEVRGASGSFGRVRWAPADSPVMNPALAGVVRDSPKVWKA